MNKPIETESKKTPFISLVDEYGNLHYPSSELNRGGQGVVSRTKDADLAIKQPLDASGGLDQNANLRDRFQNIRILPLPSHIPISLPLAILRDQPGYVMRLLNGMKPLSVFDLDGKTKIEMREALATGKKKVPEWLAGTSDEAMLKLLYYAETGSTRRRLRALSKCASILARLHSAGLVYGDISPNNVFISDCEPYEVWLIDADNLRFERCNGGSSVYTPHYGAPEIVQGRDSSRPRTDCWAFAVMAFMILALCHPFIGKKVQAPDENGGGWDAEPAGDGVPADLDEQAYAGYLPFVDDEDDDTNTADSSSLPRELVATAKLRRLFQETLGVGRENPYRRPAMAFWALELAKAADLSLTCPSCNMSYFADDHKKCPYCQTPRPAFVRAKTNRWEMLLPVGTTDIHLPNRLFRSFSFENNDNTEYEAVLDFSKKTAMPFRGTRPFPDGLRFEFVEAVE